jgi:hypothetical protein
LSFVSAYAKRCNALDAGETPHAVNKGVTSRPSAIVTTLLDARVTAISA